MAVAVVAAGCADPDDADRGSEDIVLRDSADIRIVEHPPGPFIDTVSDAPVLTIGREGDPDYELFGVTGVVALASGNVVVLNSGTDDLRFYGPDGEHLRTVGRSGDGPAEFGFPSEVRVRRGDTLAVKDSQRQRVVRFDSAGVFLGGESWSGDLPSQPEGPFTRCLLPGLSGVLSDGARVMRGWGCMRLEGSDGIRVTPLLMYVSRSGARDTLGVFAAARVWERGSATDPRNRTDLIPFQGALRYAVGRDRIYVTEGRSYQVRVFDGEGRLVSLLREDRVPPAVTADHRARYRAAREEEGRPLPDDVPFPERFGAYDRLVLSHEGRLWARRTPRPGDELRRWTVFSADGEEVRRVVLPEMRVRSVRAGRVYGVRTDELDIQTVTVHRLGG